MLMVLPLQNDVTGLIVMLIIHSMNSMNLMNLMKRIHT